MSVVEVLERLGGTATRAQLVALTSRAEVDRATTGGELVRLARGRWAHPAAGDAVKAARRSTGTVSHTSAALLHGWSVKAAPARPHVTVPPNRKHPPDGVRVHWAGVSPAERDGVVTTPDRTLTDCLRSLPFDEALAVADSALRNGFGAARLEHLVAGLRGRGSPAARRVAALATGLAANPFESVLRAIALGVRGLAVEPQVEIWEPEFLGRVDLADRGRRIVLEADSFAWHGGRDQLASDCRRYNQLVVHGWLVLRFPWEDVMHHPLSVRAAIEAHNRLAGPRGGAVGWPHRRSSRHQRRASGRTARQGSVEPDGWPVTAATKWPAMPASRVVPRSPDRPCGSSSAPESQEMPA